MQELLDSVKSLSGKERKALAALLKKQKVNLYGVTPIFKREPDEQPLLSYAQQRQWFLWQLEPESAAYNIATALSFKGDLNLEALQQSFQALIARHETLRTTFDLDGDNPVQIISTNVVFTLDVETVEVADESALRARVEHEMARPFDLLQGPLLRVKLLQRSARESLLVLTLHHIVSDGWSMPVMVKELVQLYTGYCSGRPASLPELPIQYADYAIWQRNWMGNGERERQLAYWQAQLGDEQPVLELPVDHSRPVVRTYAGDKVSIELEPDLVRALKQLAHSQGVTLFMLLLASFQTLLHRYSAQNDIRVGVPVANRSRVQTEPLIGFFVNTQVLKAEFDLGTTFIELLEQIRKTVLDAQAHQDLPFQQLIEALHPERSLNHNPLFQVMYNHQTQLKGEGLALPGLEVQALEYENRTVQFDLTLDTFESETGVWASLSFATELFERKTVERMGRHWHNILQTVVHQPQQRLAELPLLNEAEYQQIVDRWNGPQVSYPVEQCIHQMIEAQVARTPEAIALVFGEQSLSYTALNQRANRLAHKLRELGVGPDVLVGLAVERGLEMVVGLLGILKAGGAYVPLDPEYPQDRLAYMLQDSAIRVLLSQAHLQAQLPILAGIEHLTLEAGEDWLADYSDANPVNLSRPDNLAYVIYTSGSTGKPKGTLLPHHNVLRLFQATDVWFEFNARDVWTIFHSYAFDFSVWELYGALLYGGKAVIVPKDVARSPESLHALLHREQVTVLNQTPSAFKQLIPVACESPQALALRYVVFGGEALDIGSLAPWFERFGDCQPQLINMYGITETTVHVTYRPLCKADQQQASVSPIGEVIPDLSWYLLDGQLNPALPGVAGELHIGRAGLARGYHQRPALTAERFIPNPFDTSEQGGGRLYRSGDLGRSRGDGEGGSVVEYGGRIDHQVKIRGFRIELGEIEARVKEHPGVREAVVLDMDGPVGKQLVAYVVPAQADQALPSVLREALKAAMPDYMMPAHFVFIDDLPLTANGKLDRRALPKPDASQQQQAYVAPQTKLQQQVAAIWADVLKVERAGLTDNFFELGGHSLLATQVISRIRQTLGIELPLRVLFEVPMLESFVLKVVEGSASRVPAFEVVDRALPLPQSFAQQRLWFLWQLDPDSAAYNMPTVLKLTGVLDHDALRRSFQSLIARHETLRTNFHQEGERALQVIHAIRAINIPCQDLASEADVQACIDVEIEQPFDLIDGALLRVKLLRLAQDQHVLVLTMHHIVSDGWSMPVMVEELISLYEGYSQDRTVEFPVLPIQYADYAVWQRNWMEAGEQARQLAYWTEQLGGEQPVLELPLDRPRPSMQSHSGASLELDVSVELAGSLKQLARQQGVTLFMVLLASFQSVLHRHSGQADIRVGVPNANRNQAETERLIGFFVNTQVLKAEFDLGTTFIALLQQIKGAALGAQAHQDLPFEQLVDALKVERSFSHTPLFQVMFNHQTEVKEASRALPGLQVESLDWAEQLAKFDLTLNTFEHESGIVASLNYATALFDASTIERLGRHWVQLLERIAHQPERRIAELPLLSGLEQQQIVSDWNSTQVTYPAELCIHESIEQQVEKTPDTTALVFGERSLSYAELNQRANRLAHKLRELGVGPDLLIGIAVERSVEMVVGLLGILKAGGAYVPLDPEYPQDRLSYMMQDSGIGLLLTQSTLLAALPVPEQVQVLSLDLINEELSTYSDTNPLNETRLSNLAYVIYTSGSTGKPKGAGNSHGALFNRLAWMQKSYGLDGTDTVLQKTPFSFDVSVWEFFWPLQTGARLVVAQPGEHRDPEQLIKTIQRHEVSTLHFVPSMLQVFMASAGVESCQSIRRIVCSGEALPGELARKALQRLPQAGVFNLYGPTEAAIDVTHWTCGLDEGAGAPIGVPIDNLKTHILAPGLLPAAPGCVGELYLGGIGLARGYHQRPALTAERFVPDAYDRSEQGGGRLYRTGDLACYRDNGVIDYLGRTDHQVKIRGLRIELGEIEARLLEHEAVREAVVVDVEGPGGKQLAGYLVTDAVTVEQQNEIRSLLREHLQSSLPDYMVPSHWLFLDKLPLSPNGKLDRKALPKPDASQQQQVYVAPKTELEQQIAAIWAQVLKVERVGLTDNFFELGGHSLLAAQLISQINAQLGIDVPLRLIFESPMLSEFSLALESHGLSLSDDGLSDIEKMMNEMAEV